MIYSNFQGVLNHSYPFLNLDLFKYNYQVLLSKQISVSKSVGGLGGAISKSIKSTGNARESDNLNKSNDENISESAKKTDSNEAQNYFLKPTNAEYYQLKEILNKQNLSSKNNEKSSLETWSKFSNVQTSNNSFSGGFTGGAGGGGYGGGGGSSGGGGGFSGGFNGDESGAFSSPQKNTYNSNETESPTKQTSQNSNCPSCQSQNITAQQSALPTTPIETIQDVPGDSDGSFKEAYNKLLDKIKISSYQGNVSTSWNPSSQTNLNQGGSGIDITSSFQSCGGEVIDVNKMSKTFSSKPEEVLGMFTEMVHGNDALVEKIANTGLKVIVANDVTDCYAYYCGGRHLMVLGKQDNGTRTAPHEFMHYLDDLDGRIDAKLSFANLDNFNQNMALSIKRVRDSGNNVVAGMNFSYAENYSRSNRGSSTEAIEYLAEFGSFYAQDSNKFRQSFPELAKNFDSLFGAHGATPAQIR